MTKSVLLLRASTSLGVLIITEIKEKMDRLVLRVLKKVGTLDIRAGRHRLSAKVLINWIERKAIIFVSIK